MERLLYAARFVNHRPVDPCLAAVAVNLHEELGFTDPVQLHFRADARAPALSAATSPSSLSSSSLPSWSESESDGLPTTDVTADEPSPSLSSFSSSALSLPPSPPPPAAAFAGAHAVTVPQAIVFVTTRAIIAGGGADV